MPTAIRVTFFGMSAFTGRDQQGHIEWPPSPARLFSALTSVSDDRSRSVLRSLETQVPPTIFASETPDTRRDLSVATAGRKAPLLTGSGDAVRKNTPYIELNGVHAGAPGTLVTRQGPSVPASPEVTYLLARDLDEDQREALAAAAGRVPYLGRSTDAAVVQVLNIAERPDGVRWSPVVGFGPSRCWAPGYLDALDRRFSLDIRGGGPLNNPAHPDNVTVNLAYIPTADPATGSPGASLRLTDTATPRRQAAVLDRIARAVESPVVPVYNQKSQRLVGLVLSGPDDSIPEKVAAVSEVVDIEPGPEVWLSMIDPSDRWTSVTPVAGPDAPTTWAQVTSQLAAATGCTPTVVLNPTQMAQRATVPTGHRLWDVEVSFPEAVVGPFRVGFPTTGGSGTLVPA